MLKVPNVLAIMCAAVAMTATAAELNFDSFLRADGYPLDPAYDEVRRLHELEEQGLQLYRATSYQRAYKILSDPARHGMKRAQHAIALMHLNGEGIEKNPLVGVALLGLAGENGDSKLQRQYEKALKKLPKKYQPLVKQQVDYYVARYGTEVQGVACRRMATTGSNLKYTLCIKYPGEYELWEWTP